MTRDTLRRSYLVATCAVVFVFLGAAPGLGVMGPPEASRRSGLPVAPQDAQHLYRIVGKVRLLLLWASADDVGGARITWRGSNADQSVALLIGSDPERAPLGVNEWGYIREHVAKDSATVFGIRTLTEGDSPEEAETRRAAPDTLAEFGVLCTRVSALEATSRTTTVSVGRDATYRHVDHVLDIVERTARWKEDRASRPPDIAPGFLTALDLMMRTSATAVRESGASASCPRLAYVYKDAIFDLIPRRIERVPYLRTRSRLFRNLLRTEVSVRNRVTGSKSGFSITFGTDGALAGIPVSAVYQPNWWFKVELELDEDQDVPSDPAADSQVSQRIAALCSPPGG
jgi:hypothetical protein